MPQYKNCDLECRHVRTKRHAWVLASFTRTQCWGTVPPMLEEAPEASNNSLCSATCLPTDREASFTDGGLTGAPFEKTVLFITSRNSSSATELCIFLFRKVTPGSSGQWFTLSLFSIILGLIGRERVGHFKWWKVTEGWGLGSAWGWRDRCRENRWVGDSGNFRLVHFCRRRWGSGRTLPHLLQVYLRLSHHPPTGPLARELRNRPRFFQIGVIEAATSPIKGRPQVRMAVAPWDSVFLRFFGSWFRLFGNKHYLHFERSIIGATFIRGNIMSWVRLLCTYWYGMVVKMWC